MTDPKQLYQGVSKAAWAYIFLYFDINLGTVSILPAFLGRYLFVSAIRLLSDARRDLKLIESFAIGLTVWDMIGWLLSFAGLKLENLFLPLSLIVNLADLYFHFQFLTDMAALAASHQPLGEALDQRLLKWRTLQAILLTVTLILTGLTPMLGEWSTIVSLLTTVLYLIAAICLMCAMFRLRKCLMPDPEE